MTKSRSQTLQNQVRILKEQMVALEEKGRHDDELVDALTARLKSKGDTFFCHQLIMSHYRARRASTKNDFWFQKLWFLVWVFLSQFLYYV